MKHRIPILISCIACSLFSFGCHMLFNAGTEDEEEECYNCTSTTTTPSYTSGSVTLNRLFPFESSTNQWRYSDIDGNGFAIDVIDTISDEQELYFKVRFEEIRLNTTQDDWFVRDNGTVQFNQSLRGDFAMFLPSSFKTDGGSFSSDGCLVSYEVLETVTLRGKTFSNAVKLDYSRALLHGFDTVYFADGIGIICLVDMDGRWPIEYLLDSASIDGQPYIY